MNIILSETLMNMIHSSTQKRKEVGEATTTLYLKQLFPSFQTGVNRTDYCRNENFWKVVSLVLESCRDRISCISRMTIQLNGCEDKSLNLPNKNLPMLEFLNRINNN